MVGLVRLGFRNIFTLRGSESGQPSSSVRMFHLLRAQVSSQYISQVTDIENRNRECLQRMPPNEFENLLHPVFQEWISRSEPGPATGDRFGTATFWSVLWLEIDGFHWFGWVLCHPCPRDPHLCSQRLSLNHGTGGGRFDPRRSSWFHLLDK